MRPSYHCSFHCCSRPAQLLRFAICTSWSGSSGVCNLCPRRWLSKEFTPGLCSIDGFISTSYVKRYCVDYRHAPHLFPRAPEPSDSSTDRSAAAWGAALYASAPPCSASRRCDLGRNSGLSVILCWVLSSCLYSAIQLIHLVGSHYFCCYNASVWNKEPLESISVSWRSFCSSANGRPPARPWSDSNWLWFCCSTAR